MKKDIPSFCLFALAAAVIVTGCSPSEGDYRQTAFRVRSDFSAELNADAGWAGGLNENVTVNADEPFRIRFEVEGSASSEPIQFRLQYRRNGADWMDLEAANFPYPEEISPLVSVVSAGVYETARKRPTC